MKIHNLKTLTEIAEETDFLTVDPFTIFNLSPEDFKTVSDLLEDWNCHSEFTVAQAMRGGTLADIAEARSILHDHQKAGHLTNEISHKRVALLYKLGQVDPMDS